VAVIKNTFILVKFMTEQTKTWPELAFKLFEVLTGEKAGITYYFDDMAVEIPSGNGPDVVNDIWKLDGKLIINTIPIE
jgi:hypothetical protein